MRYRNGRIPNQLALVALLATIVAGCDVRFLLDPGSNPTKLFNDSPEPIVIEVIEEAGRFRRFYPSKPGATVTIDTIGEGNGVASQVSLLNLSCDLLDEVSGDFRGGGLITFRGPGNAVFEEGLRVGSGDEYDARMATCVQAAKSLGVNSGSSPTT